MTRPARTAFGVLLATGLAAWIVASALLWLIVTRPLDAIEWLTTMAR